MQKSFHHLEHNLHVRRPIASSHYPATSEEHVASLIVDLRELSSRTPPSQSLPYTPRESQAPPHDEKYKTKRRHTRAGQEGLENLFGYRRIWARTLRGIRQSENQRCMEGQASTLQRANDHEPHPREQRDEREALPCQGRRLYATVSIQASSDWLI